MRHNPGSHVTFETPEFSALCHRLSKNVRHLGRFAKRVGTDSYRIYDADIPIFNAAVDRYGSRYCVQEYAPPGHVDPELAAARLRDLVRAIEQVCGASEGDVYSKRRRRQGPESQYGTQGDEGARFEVLEGKARFLVNLSDRIDTGLYLDHRRTRALFAEMAAGKRVLNLFCYTGSATVQAALAGAEESVSVDTSNTYLDWAADNLRLNGLSVKRHALVRSDVRAFLQSSQSRFDLAFVDPPTFSNSKRRDGDFEVQRDHVQLLLATHRLLSSKACVMFSTHARRFEIDPVLKEVFDVKDITRQTIDEDFKRSPRIHQVYRLERYV